jgi:hypothetical protein
MGFSWLEFMVNSVCFDALPWRNLVNFSKSLLLLLIMPSLAFAQFVAPKTMPTILPAGITPVPAVAPAKAPKIFCAFPNFDFHNVDEGGDIVHLFHIVNRGKATLKITNVSTSCGCTAAAIEENGVAKTPSAASPVEIKAGGRGVIKATYHTKGRPGHATKIITVTSDDPVNPGYQLKLDMTVIRDIDIQPEKVYLYNIQHGQSQTTTVKIIGKPKALFKVLSAQATGGAVTVSSITPYTEEATHRYGATLQIDVPATHVIGNFTDTIKVQTNSKKRPELNIDVWGEVVGKFTFSPHSVYFSPHQTNPMTVSFTATDAKNFVIRSVESLHHLSRPYVKKVNFGNGVEQYQVLIDPPKNLAKGSDGKDTIRVTTNDPEQPQVSIDVQVSQ